MAEVKLKTTVKLRAKADCESHSLTEVAIRDLVFPIDEPLERGGTNLGPTPTDAAIASLIACTNVIGNKCAAKLGIDVGHLTIDAVCDFDRRGVTLVEEIEVPFEAIALTILADGPCSESELDQVAIETAKFCPVAKLFIAAGTKLQVSWHKK